MITFYPAQGESETWCHRFEVCVLSRTLIEHYTYNMRPEIPEPLANDAERAAEQHGYGSASELVREATRRWIEELKQGGGK